ncbi:MAG: hypothetical protein AAGA54_24380 [Myxococcota bacterium]
MWQVLLDTETVLLRHHPVKRVVVMTRTAVELPPDVGPLRAFLQSIVDAMDGIDRSIHEFVIDSRDVVGRNDEAFEALKREYEGPMLGGYRRVSVIVRSQIGRLQVNRYNEVLHERTMEVYDTLEDAIGVGEPFESRRSG